MIAGVVEGYLLLWENGFTLSTGHALQVWARCRAVAVAQVLEYGIAAHSVIIGIALGVSSSPCTIRPLAAALVFHQMFEGIALGATLISAGYHGCVLFHCYVSP